ncbi:MspI family type II restriction endonuclease [Clostridium tyrobutyricum]|uniref:MspI family type II restriction endonuclease n=1 Tax=Clostridium tyrobutyricum TaxID=1519 RepID=UPI002B21220D|nr:MspI family type II restriction endonuclease [Clostridium tyrobutyricum]MEA5009133.1 MspI family type II restriction endonuclease [Clostridium tyrobutyricum]
MNENFLKSKHGNSAKEKLKILIAYYQNKGYIKECQYGLKVGYSDFNKKQFYFQFFIILNNNEKWIIQSTTSIRNDRINVHQWNAFHIKNIIKCISKAIITFPDNIEDKEREIASKYNKEIIDKKIFSSIDCVISLDELSHMIEKKYLENMVVGKQKAYQGNNFEEILVEILNNIRNIEKWNNNLETETGFNYPYFNKTLRSIGLESSDKISSINATRKIPLLPSRGKPKTDILLNINFRDGHLKTYTFSCKRTSNKWVSVHQYDISSFVDVLKIKDPKLIESLEQFQEAGGKKALKAINDKYVDYLENNLPQYNKKLAYWVLGGIYGEGTPDIHWAKYIITYKNETCEFKVHKLEKYVDGILKVKGQFGTPFTWTYASGCKGKSVQLKSKIL